MKIICGIYQIKNKQNQKCYIGQSKNIYKRWNAHKSVAYNEKSPKYNLPIYKAIRKYGLEKFEFVVQEECSNDSLNELEKYYISLFHSNESRFGYNIDDGGNSCSHYKVQSKEKVLEIIEILRTKNQSTDKIGKIYGVSGRTIRSINTGEQCFQHGVVYPIRQKFINKDNINKKEKCFCRICGKETTGISQYCRPCSQRKILDRPNPIEIAGSVKKIGFVKTGEKYGVDGNTIKKWCRGYGIPYLKKELIKWYDDQ